VRIGGRLRSVAYHSHRAGWGANLIGCFKKSNKTANDTLINHQQQSSLQNEANKTNSRDVDWFFKIKQQKATG